jgi:NADH-quinone oxidoreductase subunit M
MLVMIQRVFYGDLGRIPAGTPGWDLNAREHIALWPLVILFLVMGVASPFWLAAIDGNGTHIAAHVLHAVPVHHIVEAASLQGGR